jgi:hypothetical protein
MDCWKRAQLNLRPDRIVYIGRMKVHYKGAYTIHNVSGPHRTAREFEAVIPLISPM